jgi:uncharacterized membrane protein
VVSDGGATGDRVAAGPGPADGAATTDGRSVRDLLGYETVLILAGAGIVVIVEFVFVQEQAGPGRMNTVFKTYADIWVLWAVAAGAALTHLVDNYTPELALSSARWRGGFEALSIVLVVSLSMYGAFAVSNHMTGSGFGNPNAHPEDPTLDGFRFVETDHPEEAEAIAWFDDLEGQPNIASAPGRDIYRWVNPVSSLTGVPTIAGWSHEVGYRGGDVYRSRAADVDAIYTGTPAERAFYLDVYEVEYVYVGTNEREVYSGEDLSEFAVMDGLALEQRWDDVLVYRVDQSQLDLPE